MHRCGGNAAQAPAFNRDAVNNNQRSPVRRMSDHVGMDIKNTENRVRIEHTGRRTMRLHQAVTE